MLDQVVAIMISIVVALAGIILVSRCQLWFAKHRLKLLSILILSGLIVYTIGYLAKNHSDHWTAALMAIFSTGRMFLFENDISSFENEVTTIPYYNITFGLIMTLSMFTTGMIVLSFFGYRVICKMRLKFLRIYSHKKQVYLFMELSEEVLALANDLKKQDKKAIIIFSADDFYEVNEDKKQLEKDSREKGYFVLSLNSKSAICKLCKQFRKNPLRMFLNYENDDENVSFLNEYAMKLKKMKMRSLSIYLFLAKDGYEEVLNQEHILGLDIHIIDESDLSSRELFHKYTLISSLGNSDSLNVCVVGYSEISENLYRYLTFLGQFEGIPLKLTLMDEDITNKTAVFFNKNKEIRDCVTIELFNIKPNTTKFYNYFNQNLQTFNCVIIACDNIEATMEISRIGFYQEKRITICSYVKDFEKSKLLFKTNVLKDVITFGSIKDIYTKNIIINEVLDQLAKGFHYYYSQLYHDTREWDQVSLFEKQSNRALALHIQSKLYHIGLRYTVGSDISLLEEKLNDQIIYENLAKGEHLRWNAFSYANGWRRMRKIQKYEKNKDNVLKIHSCLVSWDELDIISEHYKKDYKEMDRQLIRNIGNVLKSVGYGVERI